MTETRYRTRFSFISSRSWVPYFHIEKCVPCPHGVGRWETAVEGDFTIKVAESFIQQIIAGEKEWVIVPVECKVIKFS